MKKIVFLLVIGLISSQSPYEDLINEKVSEEYCTSVIKNIIGIIEEGYVYSDFLKAPKQPRENYIEKIDLIEELNNIKTTNRTFYDFYIDIEKILLRARDGHFTIIANESPNGFPLISSYFCLPFTFLTYTKLDEDNNTQTFLTIVPINFCLDNYPEEKINKTLELFTKKILKINGKDPYEYLEEFDKKSAITCHSLQCRYISTMRTIYRLTLSYYPFKKEELSLSIEFEGEDEIFEISYQFEQMKFSSKEFKSFYLEQQDFYFKNEIPPPKIEDIEKNFKIKMGLIEQEKNEDIWDLKSNDNKIKCKVDKENGFNVLYQSSFSPKDFDNYEEIMYKCFSKFYSNDYKMIIIEDENGGGLTELCVPFTQYVRPKILKPFLSSMKSTNLTYKSFFINDENLDPETCHPFTEKNDPFSEGITDIYNDGMDEVIHRRTNNFEIFNIFEKKIMEKKRREYLMTGKTKKPTEIIIFTDGYSFSCTSDFIKGLQEHGHAILVGYNARPGIEKSDFDAAQSSSSM